jgi:hypothetical protein
LTTKYHRLDRTTSGSPSHERPVVNSPESSRIMPLARFECLQGLVECLVLDADRQHPQI